MMQLQEAGSRRRAELMIVHGLLQASNECRFLCCAPHDTPPQKGLPAMSRR